MVALTYYCPICQLAKRKYCYTFYPAQRYFTCGWAKSEEKSGLYEERIKYLVKQARRLKGIRKILDVGCGNGSLVNILNYMGYEAEGVDISEEVVEYAKSTKRGKFYTGNAMELTKVGLVGRYDLIFANELIEHLEDPLGLLKQVKTLMNSDGYLIIETPNLKAWKRGSLWRQNIGGMEGADHRYCYTRRSLSILLGREGFILEKLVTKTHSPLILTGIAYSLKRKFGEKHGDSYEFKECNYGNLNSEQHFSDKLMKHNYCGNEYFKDKYEKKLKYNMKLLINSSLLKIFLYVPNRITEIGGRGAYIILIAKARE